MNVIVRLYWQHDLDLVALNMHPDFDMGKWMKKAVVAFAKGDEGFSIPLPRSMPYHVDLDNCSTHFVLSPEKDEDIIAVMNGFRYGQRNSAIKNIFRMYLEAPYMEPYYNEKMFAVKTRGSAKEEMSNAPKAQVATISKPASVKKATPAMPVSNKKPVALKVDDSASETVEVFESDNVNNTSNEEIHISKDVNINVNNVESASSAVIDDYTPDEDSNDGFDLFGAIGEMMN